MNSILNQKYKNIEVILINDGSKDNSGLICDEYAKKDHRIKVIHQSNSGPSVARNVGINSSSGKYIQFVDSDDQIDLNMTGRLVREMNQNTNLVISGYKWSYKLNESSIINRAKIPPYEGILRRNQFIQNFGDFYNNSLINSPCNKLYLSELVKKSNISFIENIENGEDFLFNLDYIKTCNKISIIKEPLYHYLQHNNSNSLSKKFKKNYYKNRKLVFNKFSDFLMQKEVYTRENNYIIKETFTKYLLNCFENLFHDNSKLNLRSKKKEIKEIVNDDWVRTNIDKMIKNTIQNFTVWFLVKNKIIIGIYLVFKLKRNLKLKINPLYKIMRKFNRRIV